MFPEKETMTMKTLTATNQRVQFFITYGESCSKQAKEQRLTRLEEALHKQGQFVEELFPMKQATMLDKILYDTSGNGICKIGAETLAEYAGASTRTVTTFNSALRATGQFVIGRLRNSKTNCGKLIYVDKLHANFKEIMREVFLLNANQIAELTAEQDLKENVDTPALDDEKQTSNLDISLSFKTSSINEIYINNESDKEAIKEAIDLEPTLSLDEQRERLDDYATNEYQVLLFDFLRGMPRLAEPIEENLYKLALAIGSDATVRHFHVAKDVIAELNMQLLARKTTVKTSIRALFDNLYLERLKALESPSTASQDAIEVFADKSYVSRPELFYNWIEERE